MVALLTLVGLIPRLAHFDLSLVGDELSTLWVVQGRSLGDAFHLVSSDAEISPPLNFVLAWVTTHLGSAPDLVRLPSLLAGTAAVPLTYFVGRRAIGRLTGVLAAAAMALNPFMVFYSTDGRAYAVAIAMLLCSTLAMLKAAGSDGNRWWILYGLASALAMYAHYTSAFILAAQVLWLFWAYPESRVPALLANVGAAVLFAPWVPSMISDLHSPTVDVLSALQGDGFDVKRVAVQTWAFGYPFNTLRSIPGYYVQWVGPIGLGVALGVAVARRLLSRARERGPDELRRAKGMVLVLTLALATPVAEALLLLIGGTDLFGARNLNTSSGGLALAIGALLAAIGPYWGVACATAILGSFAVGSVKSLETEKSTIDFDSAAAFIDSHAGPDDVVVDSLSAGVSPVPLTALDATLPQGRREFRIGLAKGPPPFLKETSRVPDGDVLLQRAFRAAAGHRLFLAVPNITVARGTDHQPPIFTVAPGAVDLGRSGLGVRLPAAARVVDQVTFQGFLPVTVLEIEVDDPGAPGSR